MHEIEQRVTSMMQRSHEERKQAVEPGLTVIQEEVKMQLQRRGEEGNKQGKKEKQKWEESMEKKLTIMVTGREALGKELTSWVKQTQGGNQVGEIGKLRGERSVTHGVVLELNWMMNNMQESRREELTKLSQAKNSSQGAGATFIKRWQRFRSRGTSIRTPLKAVMHKGVKTDIVDLVTPTEIQRQRPYHAQTPDTSTPTTDRPATAPGKQEPSTTGVFRFVDRTAEARMGRQ